jgi:hypothetical protein
VAELKAILAGLTFSKEISGEMSMDDDSLPTEIGNALLAMLKSAAARAPRPFDSLSDHAGGAYNVLQDLENIVVSRMQEVDAALATKKVSALTISVYTISSSEDRRPPYSMCIL